MKRHWMPFYVADYLAGTTHLTTLEHGAYLLLILHYWAKGGLPKDDLTLSRIVRLNPRSWATIRETISAFFTKDWKHVRIDTELRQAIEKSRTNSANAKKRHQDRTPSRTSETDAENEPTHTQSQSQSQSHKEGSTAPPSSKVSSVKRKRPPRARNLPAVPIDKDAKLAAEDLEYAMRIGMTQVEAAKDWLRFRHHHGAKGTVFSDWNQAWQGWCRRTLTDFLKRIPKDETPAAPAPGSETWGIDRWKQALSIYGSTNNWLSEWGPPPGARGCLVPKELLKDEDPDKPDGELPL